MSSDVRSATLQKLVVRTCRAPIYTVSWAVKRALYQASPTLMPTRAKVCYLLFSDAFLSQFTEHTGKVEIIIILVLVKSLLRTTEHG